MEQILSQNNISEGKSSSLGTNRGEKKHNKHKFGQILTTILFYMLIAIFLVIVVFLIIGYRPALVLSGSMQPYIQPGDVTVYHKVDVNELALGDIIMFHGKDAGSASADETNVTHRIIRIEVWSNNTMLQEVALSAETMYYLHDSESNPDYKKEDDENWGVKVKDLELPNNYTLKFITHGDANSWSPVNQNAEEVVEDRIAGRVDFWIPWIGIPLDFIRKHIIAFLFGAISIIILSYLVSLIIKSRER